jgi:hypothetical protein
MPGLNLGTPWRAGPSLHEPRAGLAAAVHAGRIYAAGGAGLVDPHDNFEEYDPEIGRWLDRAALPVGLERFAMASLGGRIYVAGGFSAESGAEPIAQMWSFDPETNVWQGEPDMPGPNQPSRCWRWTARSTPSAGRAAYRACLSTTPRPWHGAPRRRRPASIAAAPPPSCLTGDLVDRRGARRRQQRLRSISTMWRSGEWREGPALPEAARGPCGRGAERTNPCLRRAQRGYAAHGARSFPDHAGAAPGARVPPCRQRAPKRQRRPWTVRSG